MKTLITRCLKLFLFVVFATLVILSIARLITREEEETIPITTTFKKPPVSQRKEAPVSSAEPVITPDTSYIADIELAIMEEVPVTTLTPETITQEDVSTEEAVNAVEIDPKIINSSIRRYGVSKEESQRITEIIISEGTAYGVDPLLITAIIQTESSFKRQAKSRNGKVGLMQIFPEEAKRISKELGLAYLGDATLFHPLYNIRLGTHKLQSLIVKSNNDIPQAVEEYLKNSEKRADLKIAKQYQEKVLQIYKKLKSQQ